MSKGISGCAQLVKRKCCLVILSSVAQETRFELSAARVMSCRRLDSLVVYSSLLLSPALIPPVTMLSAMAPAFIFRGPYLPLTTSSSRCKLLPKHVAHPPVRHGIDRGGPPLTMSLHRREMDIGGPSGPTSAVVSCLTEPVHRWFC